MAATRAWVVCLWACSAAAIAPWSSWQKRVLGSEEPLRVGIIGAGIGGAATAHYVREQLPHAEIVVFEGRALGGRVKSLRAVHNDTTRASTFEAGASTFPATSPLLTELCGKLNITLAPQAARRHDGTYGVWDGRSVAYQQQQSVFLAVLSMLWRYGFSPLYLQKEVRAMESAFQQVYEHLADAAEHPAKRSAHELLAVLGLQDPSRMSLRAALRGSGLNTAFVEEVVDGVLRNNYGQTWGGVNALAGLLALRGRGDVLVAAESGNEGIVHGLLKTAGAYVLHANVTTVRYAHVDDRGAPLDMASPPNSTAPPPVKPVEVTFAGARGEARLRFDTVVVASPLPLAGLNLCTHRVPARPGPASPLAAEDTGPVAEAPQEREARDEDDNGTDAAVDADEGNGNESGPAVDAVNDTANATVGADAGAEEPGEHREDEAEDAAECSWAAPSVPYAPAHVAFVRARGVDAQFFGVEGDGAPTMLLTLDGVEEFTALQVIESNVTDVAVLRPRRDGGGGGDGDGDGAALEETNGTETLSAEAESPAGEAPAVQPSYSSAPTPDPVDLPTSAEAADVPPEDGAGHGEAAAAPPEPEAAAPPAEPLFGWLWGAPAAEPEPPSGEPAAAVDPAETGPTEGDANASEASEDAGQDAPPPADEGGASAAPAAGEECTEPAVEEAAADPAEAPAAEAEAEADPRAYDPSVNAERQPTGAPSRMAADPSAGGQLPTGNGGELPVDMIMQALGQGLASLQQAATAGQDATFNMPADSPLTQLVGGMARGVQQLLQRVPPGMRQHLSNQRISELPRSRLSAEAAAAATEPCVICHDEFVEGSEVITLACGHFFHADCITEWLRHRSNCPTCRAEV
eukprot:TRINITY_DN2226_c3_g2_i1.p1 TRINITY_DN2226_c3_g2~~TRINITY_DN2226_c3_g2_i1.p1  ORF type:complete len:860 (+),score=224.45 TRINITY_DN2226_c3_g2_i1:61-2640(+)